MRREERGRGTDPAAPGRLEHVTLSGDVGGTYLIVAWRDAGTLTLQATGTKRILMAGDGHGLRDGVLYAVREDGDGRLVLEPRTVPRRRGADA